MCICIKYFWKYTKLTLVAVVSRTGQLEVGGVKLCDGEGRRTRGNVLKPSAVRVGCIGRKRKKKAGSWWKKVEMEKMKAGKKVNRARETRAEMDSANGGRQQSFHWPLAVPAQRSALNKTDSGSQPLCSQSSLYTPPSVSWDSWNATGGLCFPRAWHSAGSPSGAQELVLEVKAGGRGGPCLLQGTPLWLWGTAAPSLIWTATLKKDPKLTV